MPLNVYFNIQDATGEVSTVTIPIPASTALTNIPGTVLAFAQLLAPLSDGGLVSAGVQVQVDVSGAWGATALLISDVQEKAEFAFRAVNGFLKRLNIPAFPEALFVPGTSQVDVTEASVAAFITAMEDGVTVNATVIQPTDIHNNDLVNNEYAVENWGRRRRRGG